ncbi:MAG: hypothetical protein ACRDSE_20080 [Pseudonocardiaceae bacterium]
MTADQMREVDRLMTEDFHITLPQMENAGRSLAQLVDPRSVLVLAGTGGNGGGATQRRSGHRRAPRLQHGRALARTLYRRIGIDPGPLFTERAIIQIGI